MKFCEKDLDIILEKFNEEMSCRVIMIPIVVISEVKQSLAQRKIDLEKMVSFQIDDLEIVHISMILMVNMNLGGGVLKLG